MTYPLAKPSSGLITLTFRHRSAALLIGLTAAFCPSLSAQSSQEAPPATGTATISVVSRLVVLDIVVTDAQGNLVPNLNKQDFTILQDGKPQNIRNFDGWNDTSSAPATPATDAFGRQDWGNGVPLTIFVLDEINTPFDEKSFAVENLRNYLRHQPALLASPSMLVTVNYTGLNTLSPYTRNRDAFLHALDHRPPALPAQISDLDLASDSFAMLRQIALAAEGLHTHKSVIWLGRGFPALDPADFDDPSNVILKKAIQDTVNLLIAARVTLYQVDPITTDARTDMGNLDIAVSTGAGLSSHLASTGTTDLLDQEFSLNRFVLATGGQLYFGRNDLDNFIADSIHRTLSFYTLSYVPPGDVDEDVYHTITVQMRNPTLHATTRQGLYSASPPSEPTLKDLGFDLKLASTSAMTFSSVAARISHVAADHTRGKVAVDFDIEDNSLQWTPRPSGDESAKITVLLVSLDKNRDIQSSVASSLSLAVKSPSDVATGHLNTVRAVPVSNKTCSIRLIVRDSSGRIGTADIGPAELSTIASWKASSHCDAK